MTLCYAPSTGGFYDTDLHDSVPDDALEVTNELRAQLMDAQAAGAQIALSADCLLYTSPSPRDRG